MLKTRVIPYLPFNGELLYCAHSTLLLEGERNLLIIGAATNTPVVIGKINKTQVDRLRVILLNTYGDEFPLPCTNIRSQTLAIKAQYCDLGAIYLLSKKDRIWARERGLPIQDEVEVAESVEATSTSSSSTPHTLSSQLLTDQQKEATHFINTTLKYYMDAYPNISATEYIDLVAGAIHQRQSLTETMIEAKGDNSGAGAGSEGTFHS